MHVNNHMYFIFPYKTKTNTQSYSPMNTLIQETVENNTKNAGKIRYPIKLKHYSINLYSVISQVTVKVVICARPNFRGMNNLPISARFYLRGQGCIVPINS